MHKTLIALAALLAASPALPQASAAIAAGQTKPSALAPSEIVAKAPKADWVAIPASDLLAMDLAPDAKGKPRRVVIQLMPPPFSQGWIGNIRKLAAAKFWDGTSINRVQDNYVVQWGDPDAEDKAKARKLPDGLATMPQEAYLSDLDLTAAKYREEASVTGVPGGNRDPYGQVAFWMGWPIGVGFNDFGKGWNWPVHCYGMIGAGRDLSPNTGSGAELYTVIGHAPRHLDRNIALVGRVIEGIEHLSSLPRGHGALGFYDPAQGDERTAIVSIRLGEEVKDLPAYEYLSTDSASFAQYADARANRRDPFFIRPAGGADICNIPVPVRRVAEK
jgi:peptidylprolyl isomerase